MGIRIWENLPATKSYQMWPHAAALKFSGHVTSPIAEIVFKNDTRQVRGSQTSVALKRAKPR